MNILKNGCYKICYFFFLVGLITQLVHNILDMFGLKHFFHDQLEVEIFMTISIFASIYFEVKKTEINEKIKKILIVGAFSNLIIATVLTIAELLEILEEHHLGVLQMLIIFLLLNSIFSLIYLLLKYKREFLFNWKEIFIYEGIFIAISIALNFLIEPIFHLFEFIGYDIVFYFVFLFCLFLWKKEKIREIWKTKKIIVISLSTATFMLLWQGGLLGF